MNEAEDTHARALDQMARLIATTRSSDLSLRTPCADWDVRALLNHVIGGLDRFSLMASGRSADWSAAPPDVAGEDPAGAYAAGRAHLEAALAANPASVDRVRPTHLIETAVHAWDLAAATGRLAELDEGIAGEALSAARQRLTPEARARGSAFGTEVAVSPDAPSTTRLAAFLGREVEAGAGRGGSGR